MAHKHTRTNKGHNPVKRKAKRVGLNSVNRYNQPGKCSLHVLEESVTKGLGCRGASPGIDRQKLLQKVPEPRPLDRSSDVLVGNTVRGVLVYNTVQDRTAG